MIPLKRPPLYAVLLSLTLTATVFYSSSWSRTSLLAGLRLKSVDSLYRWRAAASSPLPSLRQIVIVGVNDESYARINRAWPWGRSVFAVVIGRLSALKPKVIAVDFTFVGKSASERSDLLLASALGRNKNVVLASHFDEEGRHVTPIDPIRNSARAVGFVNLVMDRDAVYRRDRLLVPVRDRADPVFSFSAETACAYLAVDPVKTVAPVIGRTAVSVPIEGPAGSMQTKELQTDDAGRAWLSYRYTPEDFRFIPIWRVLAGDVRRDEIEDKIVLIGAVSPIFHDTYRTPLGEMAGVYVNANQIAAHLAGDFVRTPPGRAEPVFLILIAFFFTFVFGRAHFVVNLLLLILGGALSFAAGAGLFLRHSILVEPFPPFFVLLTTYVIVSFYRVLGTFIENMALQRLVATDDVTGLFTHRYLCRRLETAMKDTDRELCFVMMDIDNFKGVNDRHGHEAGNALLAALAKMLKNGFRRNDLVARYGGDEFSVVLFDCKETAAIAVVKKILSEIEKLPIGPGGGISVTLSAGICCNKTGRVKSAESLITCADKTLLQAKSRGKNQICLYAPPP